MNDMGGNDGGSSSSDGAYNVTSSGTNSQGNHYCSRDYGTSASNSNSYHYSNSDGSYYYSNPSGSTSEYIQRRVYISVRVALTAGISIIAIQTTITVAAIPATLAALEVDGPPTEVRGPISRHSAIIASVLDARHAATLRGIMCSETSCVSHALLDKEYKVLQDPPNASITTLPLISLLVLSLRIRSDFISLMTPKQVALLSALPRVRTPTPCVLNQSTLSSHTRSSSMFAPVPRKGEDTKVAHSYKASGKNMLGNWFRAQNPEPTAKNLNVYYYRNLDGSFYYSNPDNSRYFRSSTGFQRLITGQGKVLVSGPNNVWTEARS